MGAAGSHAARASSYRGAVAGAGTVYPAGGKPGSSRRPTAHEYGNRRTACAADPLRPDARPPPDARSRRLSRGRAVDRVGDPAGTIRGTRRGLAPPLVRGFGRCARGDRRILDGGPPDGAFLP